MKKLLLAIPVSLSLIFSVPVLAHSKHCQDSELGSVMKDMKDDLKAYVDAVKADDQTLMQQQIEKLLSSVAKAKQQIPMKLKGDDMDHSAMGHDMSDKSDMDHSAMGHDMSDMSDMDHSAMGHDMSDMSDMDHSAMGHDMSDMDHSQMENMAGMDHQTHMQHTAYLDGIEQLNGYFVQLQQANNKKEIKAALKRIKQHTKDSHKKFRLDCDK
ncbi:copper resistance protein CopA [Agarivorans sp. TSD2052]|uniref:copper resistance protein CopA n=1 Tax=Agarivorans sp. TSD2052 TaxID=2937286 RepID=UPI00200DEE02|nr:copper resistance protein CopA [Agarivorans sp. TSD2052]UPW17536.1 copper resistance protein CopA [Agarivorans sp. TSD2052]